jgi:hypothetical protein
VTQLSQEMKLMEELVGSLPHADVVRINLHPSITNWLPFYWADFNQTTLYSYQIPELDDLDKVWSGLRENIRREIRKAEKSLSISPDGQLSDLIQLQSKTFERQGLAPPRNVATLKRLYSACGEREAGTLLVARDSSGGVHAGAFIVWDERCSYYLVGGTDTELRTSGAMSLVMWEAIKFAATRSRRFDFEGSMLRGVERFFRSFGAEQSPYHHVTRITSKGRLALGASVAVTRLRRGRA